MKMYELKSGHFRMGTSRADAQRRFDAEDTQPFQTYYAGIYAGRPGRKPSTRKPSTRKFSLPKRKCVTKLSKRRVAKGSQRWIKRGSTYLLIACPVGKYNKRTKKCRVGTFAIEKVKARRGSSCPR